jgi:hypothetical protein
VGSDERKLLAKALHGVKFDYGHLLELLTFHRLDRRFFRSIVALEASELLLKRLDLLAVLWLLGVLSGEVVDALAQLSAFVAALCAVSAEIPHSKAAAAHCVELRLEVAQILQRGAGLFERRGVVGVGLAGLVKEVCALYRRYPYVERDKARTGDAVAGILDLIELRLLFAPANECFAEGLAVATEGIVIGDAAALSADGDLQLERVRALARV